MTKFLNISTDNTLGGNSPSDEKVASEKGVKDYIDGLAGDVKHALQPVVVTRTVTFLASPLARLSDLVVNGTSYSKSDFSGGMLKLTFEEGTTITWSASATGTYSCNPSSGAFVLSSDMGISIKISRSG